jgi:hypothetical protein
MGLGKLSLIQDGQIVTIRTFGLQTTHVHQLLFVRSPDGCLLRAMSLTLPKQEILISTITLGWVVYSIHSKQPVKTFFGDIILYPPSENRFHLHTTRGFLRESGYLKLIIFFFFFLTLSNPDSQLQITMYCKERTLNRCVMWLRTHLISAVSETWSYWQDVEDTKGVITIGKSKKNRKHNDQKKRDKKTNNDQQNITQKTKDRVTRNPVKTGVELGCSGRVSKSYSTSGTRRVNTFKHW